MNRRIVLYTSIGSPPIVQFDIDAAGKCLGKIKCPDDARWAQIFDGDRLIGEGAVAIEEEAVSQQVRDFVDGQIADTMKLLADGLNSEN